MWHFVQWHFARTPLEHFHLCPRTPLLHTVTFMFQGQLCVAWTNDETQLQLLCRSHSEQFRLCVLTYHCLHGTAPAYLADSLRLTSEVVARLSLRSADTTTLMVPPTRRVTFGDRAFPVAAARAWNSLPLHIRAASSLSSFRRQTKAHLSVSPVNVPAVTLTDCANNAARFYNLKKNLFRHVYKLCKVPLQLRVCHYNQYFCSSGVSSSSSSSRGRRGVRLVTYKFILTSILY